MYVFDTLGRQVSCPLCAREEYVCAKRPDDVNGIRFYGVIRRFYGVTGLLRWWPQLYFLRY